MANSSITHSAPTRPQRRRKPDPQSIYQTYLYEARERGQRYAARATADRYGVSDDTVRRIVAKHEAAERAKEEQAASDLAYIPPPFADELAAKQPQFMLSLTEVNAAEDAEADLLDRLLMSTANEDAAVEPQAAQPQHRTPELEESPQEDAGGAASGRATPDDLGAEVPETPPGAPSSPPGPNREPWGFPDVDPDQWHDPDPTPPADVPKTAASYRSASPALAAFLAQRPIEPMPRLPLRNAGAPWWQTPERGLLGLLVDQDGPYAGRIVALLALVCLIVATWLG